MTTEIGYRTAASYNLPVLLLRDIVIFPHMVVPLFIGRKKSIEALNQALGSHQKIILVAQKNREEENPKLENIYTVGTLANLVQLLKLPDGTIKVLVEGEQRCQITQFEEQEKILTAQAEGIEEISVNTQETDALYQLARSRFEAYVKLNTAIPNEALLSLSGAQDLGRLADIIASQMNLKIPDRQTLLSTFSTPERLEKVLGLLEAEIELLQVEQRVRARVKQQMEKNQREYYLNEQLKAIQKELGDGNESELSDLKKLEEKIKMAEMPKDAYEKAMAELNRLKMIPASAAEAGVSRHYLEWMLNMPWGKRSRVKHDLKKAEESLNVDHYGLEKVKERILEYLAVVQRVSVIKGPILCLVGPPGVGKTSLAQSIAKATGRNYVRFSLGGVRDEAEIRGHRRTYIGSMPGRILQKIAKAKVKNPLFLLDEIDKMTADFRGDPSAALLEVLDPEQNKAFNDHYLDVDYDLSEVMFITTANTLNIPDPLLDRLEVIDLSGYTEDEKSHIARDYLIPKILKANGLKEKELIITDEAVRDIIRYYTREAGVRNLEREMEKIARKQVKAALVENKKNIRQQVTEKELERYLGVPRYRFGIVDKKNRVGQVVGLAWTQFGGDLLTIEVASIPGKGEVKRTGNLENVMLESIDAAITVVRSRAEALGISPKFYKNLDLHFHVPEGAIKKDGPSAGITMCVALVSSLTKIPVRSDIAMTGEITLRGEILPIGGLKEKLLAALRGGIRQVIIPLENQRELNEIPDKIKKGLDIRTAQWVEEVLNLALERPPQPL